MGREMSKYPFSFIDWVRKIASKKQADTNVEDDPKRVVWISSDGLTAAVYLGALSDICDIIAGKFSSCKYIWFVLDMVTYFSVREIVW